MSDNNALNGSDPSQFINNIRYLGENTPGGETSSAGATGVMQVLPSTAASPGFGVTPAQDGSPEEIARVGRDYAKALLQHYNGNQTLASAAYNAGPGAVDQWTSEFGDPRTGQISDQEFASKIPYKETRNYVGRVTGGGGEAPSTTQAAPQSGGNGGGSGYPTEQNVRNMAQNMLQSPTSGGSLGQGDTSVPANPLIALQLMKLLTPNTHTLVPVDYNPYAPGLPGAPQKKDSGNA
jgi:hypothetical protein